MARVATASTRPRLALLGVGGVVVLVAISGGLLAQRASLSASAAWSIVFATDACAGSRAAIGPGGLPSRVTSDGAALQGDLQRIRWSGEGPTFACRFFVGWTGYAPLGPTSTAR